MRSAIYKIFIVFLLKHCAPIQISNYLIFILLFLDEKKQKSRAAEKKAKNLKPG